MQGDCEGLLVKDEVHDVEEGEISDSDSVEEITEDDFNAKQIPPLKVAHVDIPDNLKNSYAKSVCRTQIRGGGTGSGNRVWTMRDMYKYKIASTAYNSGLYNLAWAQAVNNKPLDGVFVMMEDSSNNSNDNNGKSDSLVSAGNEDSKLELNLEDETDKEEGELEEGEIDLDSDSVVNENSWVKFEELKGGLTVNDEPENKKQIDTIKKELQNLIVADADESFNRLCTSLQNSVDSLQKVVLKSSCAEKDNLAKLLLTTIKSVNSVFSSMNLRLKEQNRDILSRLLAHVTSLKPPLFSSQQLKEMEIIMASVDSLDFSLGYDIDKKKQRDGGFPLDYSHLLVSKANVGSTSLKKYELQSGSTASVVQTQSSFSAEDSKHGLDNAKPKGSVLPLLDLHKDHDAESLPSPTRDMAPSLPFEKGYMLGHGLVKPEWPVPRQFLSRENMRTHPNYETDAVKAVSSYQQKFGNSSFFRNDELPSPTPSEEGDTGDDETSGEISSNIIHNASSVGPSVFLEQMHGSVVSLIKGQPTVTSASLETASSLGFSHAKTMSIAQRPVLRSSSSKIRDPRLRLANSNAAVKIDQNLSSAGRFDKTVEPLSLSSSHKQRTTEDLVLDGPLMKRPRNDSTDSVISRFRVVTENGGWLEDKGTVGMQIAVSGDCASSIRPNITAEGNDKFQIVGQNTAMPMMCSTATLPILAATSASLLTNPIKAPPLSKPVTLPLSAQPAKLQVADPNTSTSLQSLLKDIAVNPSLWMNILQSEHQKSTDYIKTMTQMQNSESVLGFGQLIEGASSNLSVLEQASGREESGNVRMKPRDPRRVHLNSQQKGGSTGSDLLKANALISSTMTGNSGALKEGLTEKKLLSSSAVIHPDITRKFTDNVRNVADILSVSQGSMPPSVLPEVVSSQSLQNHKGGMETKSLNFEPGHQKKGTGCEEPVVAPSRLSIAWSDVEHLFEGFDDQEKAAIQKERTRRMEEQKKMFSARKLCLVLDLDHTLLNSAKFVEVDPHHDEILRKKEEEDREKSQRHLFRIPHMGMWTKLRPGIWNFLEKASKLFELHLYTMGNKSYATEMAKLLDRKGDLFSGRVISRGDDGDAFDSEDRVPKSKDLEGVLGMESAVVIIDDSVRVWPHNKLNLIVAERYIYFPCSRRQFGLPGPSLLEIDHDERPEFGTLASSLAVIERIHHNFFAYQSLDEADVRNILASEQQKILSGCRILFSRIFPVGEANPHMHPLWQTAEQFGAVCSNQIDDQVTHVVANSLGTDKVNWALSSGRFVVHPGWVEASALLYRRANEHDFSIKPQ